MMYALVIALAVLLPIAFLAGKISERMDWNELIRTGKLPKPRNK